MSALSTHPAQRVVMLNHAGGVGKTTVVRELGMQLALDGWRVLLIDLDPQANLTEWLGHDPHALSLEDTVYPAIASPVGDSPSTRNLPEPLRAFDLLDLIPAVKPLVQLEKVLHAQGDAGMLTLRFALDHLESSQAYDFVLVDPPAYLSSQVTLMATAAVDGVVVPVSATPKGISGLQDLVEYVDAFKPQNPLLGIRLIVPTMYDARIIDARMAHDILRRSARDGVLPRVAPPLRQRAGYTTATATLVPAVLNEERNTQDAKRDVRRVADAFLEAVGSPRRRS